MRAVFQMAPKSFDGKPYAYAAGYGPAEELWFLKPPFLERRQAYWNVNPQSTGLHIDAGREWPDFLANGHAPPSFFVSERVLASLRKQGIPIGRTLEMPVAEIRSEALRQVGPPRYFVVETHPGIQVDFAASGVPLDQEGKPILDPLPKPWPPAWKVKGDSWDGTGLFDFGNWGGAPYLGFLCTAETKALAESENWTNVHFRPIGVV